MPFDDLNQKLASERSKENWTSNAVNMLFSSQWYVYISENIF